MRRRLLIPLGSVLLLCLFVGSCSETPTPSILLIVVDTLRADHLGCYGYERNSSPNIDAWLTQGTIFEQAIAPSPWTLPTFASLLTGQLPSRHGAGSLVPSAEDRHSFERLDPSLPTLAELLQARGYATGAVINNPFLDPGTGIDRGFTDYDYFGADNVQLRRAAQVVDRGLAWIDAQGDRPFFLMLHFFDPHMDYDPPESAKGKFRPQRRDQDLAVRDVDRIRAGIETTDDATREFIVAAYDEEIWYVDEQLGRLRNELARRGLTDSSVVVITSDHGEELFDHGGFEHGHSVYQELLRVPLGVVGPGVQPGRIDEAVGLADLFPTLLEAAGAPPSPSSGFSLLGPLRTASPPPADRFLVSERLLHGQEQKSIIQWPWKLVVRGESGETILFDLQADPREHNPRHRGETERRVLLRNRLNTVLRESTMDRLRPHLADLPPETIDQLRALGYIE